MSEQPALDQVKEHSTRIRSDDEALELISSRAQDSFDQFVRRLQNPGPGEEDFRVKYPFPADEDSGYRYEHLWLRDIRFQNGEYCGILVNQPYYIENMKIGDMATFQWNEISDWMYRRDGKIVGGLSIRYFINGIPELDRDGVLSDYDKSFCEEDLLGDTRTGESSY